jgi:hypothetical protein
VEYFHTGTIVGLRLRQLVLFAAAGAILVVVVVVVVADVLKLCGGAGTAPKAGFWIRDCSMM